MNYLDVIKSIEHIIKTDNNLNDNNCILINGEWGIGKTYAFNQWIQNNVEDYNAKYISVFRKSKARSNDFCDELLEIASLLYKPEVSKNIPRYDSDEWFDVGFWGGPIPCSQKTASFIKFINEKNTEIFRKYKSESITKAIAEGNVDATIKIISDISVANKLTFNKIFELGWRNLDGTNHENGWKLLYKLINKSDNKLTQQFFNDYDTSIFDDMQNMRFKHLIEVFEENEYHREQAEEAARRQYEEQFERQ